MKKTFLILAGAACVLAQSALAQITLTASPMMQGPINSNGTFNVEFRLNVTGGTPANVQAFDLLIETLSANSGFFSLLSSTPTAPVSGPSGVPQYPDALTSANSSRAGFAQNQFSQGYTFQSPQSTSNFLLTTLAFQVNGAPNGTYDFLSTSQNTSGGRGSSINNSGGTTFFVNNPAQFSVTVVPEPATWSMIALGGVAAFGLNRFRAKRRA